jgi:signal transduction histidine kinase
MKSDFKNVEFFVEDNGVGISDEDQKDLFKKFYQVDTSSKRKKGGSGLGLAICKGIIDGLGGKIWVESEKNVKTTFFFKIPKKTGGVSKNNRSAKK